ncbi:MAG: PfkB family carbohydrate kinase [Bacteroidota bacterium]
MKGLFVGLTSIDIIYPLDGYPEENTKQKCEAPLMDIGGPATNAAYAFQSLGGEATLVSLIGNTPFSAFMIDKIKSYGLTHMDLNPGYSGHPEVASIVVNRINGSRTVTTARPNQRVDVISPDIEWQAFDVVCIDGFFGNYLLDMLPANEEKIPVVFDGGSYKKHTSTVLNYVDYPILSERFTLPNQDSLIPALQEKGKSKFAFTRGEKPLLVYEGESSFELAVPVVKAVDTLAAGDIFHGAFSYYIAQEPGDFKRALEQAGKVASLSCRFSGPRKWVDFL